MKNFVSQTLRGTSGRHGIVIPCYNESSRLNLEAFIKVARQREDIVLCFVNDGSADMTRATLANIKNVVHDNVFICHVEENAGKASAVLTGTRFLYNETDVDTIGFLDADLSTGFEDYQLLIDALHAQDERRVIFGSRNLGGAENVVERNLLRKLLSNFIRLLIFFITRLRIADTQCGAKVFAREVIPYVYDQPFRTRWLFDVEILMRMKRFYGIQKFRQMFHEHPLKEWVHMDDSKLGMKDALMIPASLLVIYKTYNILPALALIKKSFKRSYDKGLGALEAKTELT